MVSTHFRAYKDNLENYHYMKYGETFERGMFSAEKMSYTLILFKGGVC